MCVEECLGKIVQEFIDAGPGIWMLMGLAVFVVILFFIGIIKNGEDFMA